MGFGIRSDIILAINGIKQHVWYMILEEVAKPLYDRQHVYTIKM